MRDEAECPCSPKDPLPPYAPASWAQPPALRGQGALMGFHKGDPGVWVQMGMGRIGEGEVGSRCPLGWAWGLTGTSRMTAQICLTHWMMVSGTPETVTARSVELGSKSPATCTCAPVLCRK